MVTLSTGRRLVQAMLIAALLVISFALMIAPAYTKSLSGVFQGVWSPDGKQIAIAYGDTESASSSIYIVNASDLTAIQLVSDGNSPMWSPDGKQIAFSKPMTEGIYTIPVDHSGSVTELSGSGYTPIWSSDGKSLAYVDAGILYVMNTDGTNRRALTDSQIPQVWGPRWSPDDRSIAFVSNENLSEQVSYYVVGVDGAKLLKLGESTMPDAPTWSPDGSQIALVSRCGKLTGLCVINPDGSDPHSIGSGWGVQWSPDGEQLAYILDTSICTVEPDGSNQHCLPDQSALNISNLALSPDGQQLFFTSMQQGEGESREAMSSTAYLMNMDGSNLRVLSDDQFSG